MRRNRCVAQEVGNGMDSSFPTTLMCQTGSSAACANPKVAKAEGLPMVGQTMMRHTGRFIDTGKSLSGFADKVLVTCVHCVTPGVVHAKWSPCQWRAGFECSNCHLALASWAEDWVGPVRIHGRQPCGHRGHKWLTPDITCEAPPENRPAQLAANCPMCGPRPWSRRHWRGYFRQTSAAIRILAFR